MQNRRVLIAVVITLIIVAGLIGGGIWWWSKNKPSPAGEEKIAGQISPTGPYYHQVYLATSQDGINWEKQGKILFDHASVPGAVIKDGIIYVYFVDAGDSTPTNPGEKLSVGISRDLGKTFEKKTVSIKDVKSSAPVDPHPVLLKDNKIRLYYFKNVMVDAPMDIGADGDPAKAEGAHEFCFVESTDGINFGKPQLAYKEEGMLTDPDVFETASDWRMLISKGQELILAISTDKGKNFQKDADFSWNQGGVPDTFKFPDAYRTFYCGEGIHSATGADAGKLTVEAGIRITADEGKIVCDPSVIQLSDGTYLMFYKTQETPVGQGPAGQSPEELPSGRPPADQPPAAGTMNQPG